MLTKTTAARAGTTAGVGLAVLLAGLLSLLWWRVDASACRCEYCPHGYCEYAQWLGAVLTRWDTASLIRFRESSRDYIHAHNPLGPLLQALVVLLIPHPLVAYMVVSGAASLFAGFAMRRVVAATGSPPPGSGALILAAFYTHVLVIRAFARPISDALGMACTIGVLWALQRYLKTRTMRAAVVLLGGQLVGLFSRVSLISMLGMSVLGELLVPEPFPRRARRALRSGVLFGLIPAALFLGINAILGTLHLRSVWEFAHREDFTGAYTVRDFLASLRPSPGRATPCSRSHFCRATRSRACRSGCTSSGSCSTGCSWRWEAEPCGRATSCQSYRASLF